MNTTGSTTPAPQPDTNIVQSKPTAEQLLSRLLDAIRDSDSIHDFTPDYLSKAMGIGGVGLMPDVDGYAFAGEIEKNWLYSLGITYDRETRTPLFGLSFLSTTNDARPDTAGICQLDFEQFSHALEAMGFRRHHIHPDHGPRMGDTFSKPRMNIHVHPWAVNDDAPSGKMARLCIQNVVVQ